jgi:hypothetical protein
MENNTLLNDLENHRIQELKTTLEQLRTKKEQNLLLKKEFGSLKYQLISKIQKTPDRVKQLEYQNLLANATDKQKYHKLRIKSINITMQFVQSKLKLYEQNS